MTPLEIQFELKKKGILQKTIAEETGVSQMMISKVIRKESVSDKIMKEVASRLGRDHRELFPEHYFNKNRRKRSISV